MPAVPTAVGLFLKYPEPGAVKSQLLQSLGPERAARLYWECALIVMAKALRLRGVALFVFLTPPERRDDLEAMVMERFGGFEGRFVTQSIANLGARIHGALLYLKEQGYAQQIVMGTDAPTLPVEHLQRAVDEIAGRDCVIGPTWGGAYYLIGVRKPDSRIFEGVSWGAGTQLDQTHANLTALGLDCLILPRWSEIDSADDLPFLEGQVRNADYRRLKRILDETR